MRNIDFIEACYRRREREQGWASDVVAAASKLVGHHFFGVGAYSYRVSSAGSVDIIGLFNPPGSHLVEDPVVGSRAFIGFVNRSPMRRKIVSLVFETYSERSIVLSDMPDAWGVELRRRLPPGASDSLCMHGAVNFSEGFHLCLLRRDGSTIGGRKRRYLDHLAGHLAAGYRVQRALAGVGTDAITTMAVASPSGRVLDARGRMRERGARRTFAESVRQLDRARCRRMGKEPNEAARLWMAFVDGEYSLVETFDSDGQRMILAVRTRTNHAARLTSQERIVVEQVAQGHANKEIGATLGISSSTVAVHLHLAMKKLGFRDRQSLVLGLESRGRRTSGL